jgi:outer membrane protein OmpA-like peptidoglycan-associated protein
VTVPRRLDRKTRIAVCLAATALVAGPVLALGNCVSKVVAGNGAVAAVHPSEDGLVRLENGATLYLPDGSLSRRISEWLDADVKPTFKIADTNFVPGSAELSRAGGAHVAQVAQILEADPQLTAEIVVSDELATDDPLGKLELSRASRLHAELIDQDVPASKITSAIDSAVVSPTDQPVGGAARKAPQLFLILSR